MDKLENIRKKINSLQESRSKSLQETKERIEEALKEYEAAAEDARTAEASCDVKALQEASDRRHKANENILLYRNRLEQIEQEELATEQESDDVLDELDGFQQEQRIEFEKEIFKRCEELSELAEKYLLTFADAENLINEWQRDIHKNFRVRTDGIPGARPYRSNTPVPFHFWGMTPGYIFRLTKSFLTNIEKYRSKYYGKKDNTSGSKR